MDFRAGTKTLDLRSLFSIPWCVFFHFEKAGSSQDDGNVDSAKTRYYSSARAAKQGIPKGSRVISTCVD